MLKYLRLLVIFLFLLGMAGIATGAFIANIIAGFIVTGVILVLIAVILAIEMGNISEE